LLVEASSDLVALGGGKGEVVAEGEGAEGGRACVEVKVPRS
jgi:hypothetical protein